MRAVTPMDRARDALENGRRPPLAVVPEPIAESWRRSLAFELEPGATPREIVLPFAEVGRRRENASTLRALALAEMRALREQIGGPHNCIAFADADGVVLDTLSDNAFAESEASRAIIPGSIWRESARGTNALGLAAITGRPAAVYGREHFFASDGLLSCMAAPIVDARGELVGLIDASCASEARRKHAHALVRMAAAEIENNLLVGEYGRHVVFAFHPRGEFLHTLSAGLLAVSREGEIHAVNRAGAALLAGLPARNGAEFVNVFASSLGDVLAKTRNGDMTRLRDRIGSTLFVKRCGADPAPNRPLRGAPPSAAPGFICADSKLQASLVELEAALALRMPVHLFGETGVGKELMARHAHALSRRKGNFIAVNCGAVPESLFVAELFGHVRGAFTNARAEGSPGFARLADGGTLFLDEVGDIPAAAQSTLLRFLDDGETRAVGASAAIKVDVQIISAANRRLSDLVESRQFRPDLMYRLSAFVMDLPPLRVRTDFAEIARALAAEISPGASVSDAAIARLAQCAWPGNIRELRHALQRALIRGGANQIGDQDLVDCADARACPACRSRSADRRFCEEIDAAYRRSAGNIAEVARNLGLSRTTVYKHLARS